jgi:hypothetical protein
MAGKDEYEIAVIENETDARLCCKLIAQEFASHNPLTIHDRSTPEELFDEWVWPFMIEILNEKLSFFARHRPTNEIVATILASDLFLYCEKHPYDASGPASHNATFDLFDDLLNRFVQHEFGQKLKPNIVLAITIDATHSQHSGKGLTSKLSKCACDYARDTRGFQYAFVQTCHPAARHIYVNKMNGEEKSIHNPATWIWEKKGDGVSCPEKDYKGEPIVNILIKLK